MLSMLELHEVLPGAEATDQSSQPAVVGVDACQVLAVEGGRDRSFDANSAIPLLAHWVKIFSKR
jgi:hypothetical protein